MRYFLLFILCLGAAAQAQQATAQSAAPASGQIRGAVADSASGKVLREASVSLLTARDSSYLSFTVTDGDGRFTLRGVAPGRYFLVLTFLGYKSRLVPLTLTPAAPSADVGTLPLRATSQTLGEVVVQQERAPVSVQGDTVSFSARAFKTQPNAQVEQLLKKLPGVQVDRDGTIRAQGQTVQRVLVDGKPFFGDDPKVATRNLPANIIDQVQLYNQQSDQAQFSGIDDGQQQKTLNLVTKRDKRKGWFGTEAAGLGTDGRYRAQLGLNRFNNGRQLSALAQANNLNQQGFSDQTTPGAGDLSSGPGATSAALPGGFGGVGGPIVVGSGQNSAAPSGLNNQPTGITEALAGGLNYRDAWGRRAEVATSYLATRAVLRTDQLSHRETAAGGLGSSGETAAPLFTDQQSTGRSTTLSQRLNLRLDYKLDSLTSLRFTPAIWWQQTDELRRTDQQLSRAGQPLSQSQRRYQSAADNRWGSGNLLLMRKFARPGRSLSANLATTINDQNGTATNQADNAFFAADGRPASRSRLDQRIEQAYPARNHSLNLAYVEPLNLRQKLELHAYLSTSRSPGRRTVADFDSAAGYYGAPVPGLSNDFRTDFQVQRTGLTWQTHRLRYSYALGLDAQQAQLGVDNHGADSALTRHYRSLLPNAMLTWNGPRNRTLRLNYRTRLQAPTAPQLQPVADNTNPLYVRLGNPTLRPEYYHTLTATYNQFTASNNRSVSGLLSATQVQNRIVAATTLDAAGVQTTRPLNADGYHTLNGFLSLGQRLGWHQLNVNLTTSGSYTRSRSLVNAAWNQARNWSLGQGLSLNTAYNDKLELGFAANVTYLAARYSLLPQQNQAYWASTLSADVFYQLPGHFTFSSDLWLTRYAGRAAGYNPSVALWNVAVARQLFRNRQGELKLQIYDALGQNRSVVRNTADTYVEDVRSQVLTRYVLLNFSYQLRRFGQ